MNAPPIHAWLDQLRRRFSPARIRLGPDGPVVLERGGGSSTHVLVGRELCLFQSVDASQIPARQRAAFVELAVRRAAPFNDPEHDVLWLGGHAAVWFWSRARIRGLAGSLSAGAVRYRAEALFRGWIRAGEYVELLTYADAPVNVREPGTPATGIEARVWKQGRLVASRWWGRIPDAMAWQAFARGLGLPAASVPEPVPAALQRGPLASANRTRAGSQGLGDIGRLAPMAATAVAVAALAALAWQAGSSLRLEVEARRLQERITRVSGRLQPVIGARENADRAIAEVNSLLALRPVPSQTRLLAEVARTVPGTWQMTLWHMPSPDVLEMTLRIQQPDVPTIVGALENSPLLQDVSPQSAGKDELKIQARLTPFAGAAP